MTGLFVTFEGVEGAGKSSVIRSLADALAAEHPVWVTREPGDGPVGAKIRTILLEGETLTHLSEVFLFLADRAQHVATQVLPALEEGKIVLCDRYADSTVVYQGYARGLDVETLRAWNAQATSGLQPAITFLLDLDPAIGLSRQTKGDRLDREPLEFHERVRQGFLAEAQRDSKRWVVIDANQSPEVVAADCLRVVKGRLGNVSGAEGL